jgi:hypothetical protein
LAQFRKYGTLSSEKPPPPCNEFGKIQVGKEVVEAVFKEYPDNLPVASDTSDVSVELQQIQR